MKLASASIYTLVTPVGVPVTYRGQTLDFGFRLDLLVEDALIVEIKTVRALAPIHHARLLSYLRLTGHRIGLLVNFHAVRLKDGLKRIVDDRDWQMPQ